MLIACCFACPGACGVGVGKTGQWHGLLAALLHVDSRELLFTCSVQSIDDPMCALAVRKPVTTRQVVTSSMRCTSRCLKKGWHSHLQVVGPAGERRFFVLRNWLQATMGKTELSATTVLEPERRNFKVSCSLCLCLLQKQQHDTGGNVTPDAHGIIGGADGSDHELAAGHCSFYEPYSKPHPGIYP